MKNYLFCILAARLLLRIIIQGKLAAKLIAIEIGLILNLRLIA